MSACLPACLLLLVSRTLRKRGLADNRLVDGIVFTANSLFDDFSVLDSVIITDVEDFDVDGVFTFPNGVIFIISLALGALVDTCFFGLGGEEREGASCETEVELRDVLDVVVVVVVEVLDHSRPNKLTG
uniref:Uncharacterized protein n=1 Tax=Glossina brevipalpis TaxID=37001 RepID=A0A1A9WS24_9MUSC